MDPEPTPGASLYPASVPGRPPGQVLGRAVWRGVRAPSDLSVLGPKGLLGSLERICKRCPSPQGSEPCRPCCNPRAGSTENLHALAWGGKDRKAVQVGEP